MYVWNQVNCTKNHYEKVGASSPYKQWSYPKVSCPHHQFPKSVSMFGWVGHSVHEQVDVVRPIFEIIEWFKVLDAVHEAIKVLIEWGLG